MTSPVNAGRDRSLGATMTDPSDLAGIVEPLLGTDLPVAFECYDGSRFGPPDARATVVVRSSDALRRVLFAPGELGLARAFVAGDVDFEGDIFAVLELPRWLRWARIGWRNIVGALRLFIAALRLLERPTLRPLPRPAEEARPRSRLHSRARDAAAIAHHYDVGNEFYRLLLGPTMTYSCAVWGGNVGETGHGLERAQRNKFGALRIGHIGRYARPGPLLDREKTSRARRTLDANTIGEVLHGKRARGEDCARHSRFGS